MIDTRKLVQDKEEQNVGKALGLTAELLQKTHEKYMAYMLQYCDAGTKTQAVAFKDFIGNLNAEGKRAVLFFGFVELNRAMFDRTKNAVEKKAEKKKIIIPGED